MPRQRGFYFFAIFIVPLVILAAVGYGQDAGTRSIDLENPPSSSTTSPVIDMAQDQWLRVDAVGTGQDFNIDVFVYNAATKELMGMTDDDSNEPFFRWTAPQTGRYYLVLRNTSPVPGRSRLTVMPTGSKGAVKGILANASEIDVFYATDRMKTTLDNGTPFYGSAPAADRHLEYGLAKVTVPRDHRMGELEGLSITRLEFGQEKGKGLVLKESQSENAAVFFESLRNSRKQQLLVFVHGFNVTFKDAVLQTAQLEYDLGLDGDAVLYSWPSQGTLDLASYERDGVNAKLSAELLRKFLTDLSRNSGGKPIHLIAHSMGNRVAVRALAGMSPTQREGLRVQHVALMAPDIDATEFVSLAKAVKESAKDVTLYASSRDAALEASAKLASGHSRAGEGGADIVVLPGLIETIDASGVETSLGLHHSYYADNSTILADVFHLIRGDLAARRFGLQKVQNEKGPYWIFRPSAR